MKVGSTRLIDSYLSDAVRNGSVGDFISQSMVLSGDNEDLLMHEKLYMTQLNHLISIMVHIDSQPNEYWAALNLDVCVPSLNVSSSACEEWLETIRSPLILYECYFKENASGPKIRQIPYASLNSDPVSPTGFVTFRREMFSNNTDFGEEPLESAKENEEQSNALIPSIITMIILATLVIAAVIRMWPSARRGYEVVA